MLGTKKMNRSTLDKLISSTGIVVAVALFALAGGLAYAHNFIHSQVRDQLSAQKITFPAANSPAMAALPAVDRLAVAQYAGQQLVTGAQAEVFADHYINAHLASIGGGKTYSELSTDSRADPANTKLSGQVDTVFRGETLRGMLLNAYAFDTMATVARIAAFGATFAGLLLLILASLGFYHSSTATTKRTGSKRNRK